MNGGWGHRQKTESEILNQKFWAIIVNGYTDRELERCQTLSNLAVDRGRD